MADIEFILHYTNPPIGGASTKTIEAEELTLAVDSNGNPREPGTTLDVDTVEAFAPVGEDTVTIHYTPADSSDDIVIGSAVKCGEHDGELTNTSGSGPNASQEFTVPSSVGPEYCWEMDDIGSVAVHIKVKIKRKAPPSTPR